MKEYMTVEATDDIQDFVDQVNAAMKEGWKPLGGLSMSVSKGTTYYAQAMVRKTKGRKEA